MHTGQLVWQRHFSTEIEKQIFTELMLYSIYYSYCVQKDPMGILNKIINGFIRFSLLIVTLLIALLPVIYLLGTEQASLSNWNPAFTQFSSWGEKIPVLKDKKISNIYIKTQKGKPLWQDINSTLALTDYLHYQLEKQGIFVVKKIVNFKKPVSSKQKKSQQQKAIDFGQVQTLKQNPPLKWLKQLVEPHINFEHQSTKQKNWLVVILGDLDPKIAKQIESIQKSNSLYKFTIISIWQISSKLIDIFPIALPIQSNISPKTIESSTQSVPPVIEATQKNQTAIQSKESKQKKEKKYKVKKVKEVKEQVIKENPQQEL